MAFDAISFKNNLSASLPTVPKQPVTQPTNVTPAPAQPSPVPSYSPNVSSLQRPATQKMAQSTPATGTGADTKDLAVGAVKILNPFHAIQVRPAFARGPETVPLYGGGLIAGAHDIAARTLEAVPNIALRTLANYSPTLNKGVPKPINLPFDASRIGVENPNPWKLVGADMDEAGMKNLVNDYKQKGISAAIRPDATQKPGVYIQEPNNKVTDTGTAMLDKFEKLQKENPGKTKTNIGLAVLAGPVTDALNAFVLGDLATASAKQVLRATRYSPDLDFALQTYGIKNSGLTGEDFTAELTKRFNQKAAALVAAEDHEGLNALGRATNIILTRLTGRGVPQLSRFGHFMENVSRTALQDSKYGFHLQHPFYPEAAPEWHGVDFTGPNGSPGSATLPGTREMPGQAPALGMSTRRMERVGGSEETPGVTTRILEKLKGKESTSKEEIMNLTNSADVKQPEKNLIRDVLASYGDKVDVQDFTNKVKSELLPLERKEPTYSNGIGGESKATRYESVTLPDEVRGPVANYSEHVYHSPIKTSAGGVHFDDPVKGGPEDYFAHSRVEDLPSAKNLKHFDAGEGDYYRIPELENEGKGHLLKGGDTRRVIEVQSDLFQKGRLEGEGFKDFDFEGLVSRKRAMESAIENPSASELAYNPNYVKDLKSSLKDVDAQLEEYRGDYTNRKAEIAKLEPYRNTWHERIIREEVKQAAKDGKTKLQFPTGETAMKIEGLGQRENQWVFRSSEAPRTMDMGGGRSFTTPSERWKTLGPDVLKPGLEIKSNHGQGDWIITDVLGDGKFKAVPKNIWDKSGIKSAEDFVQNRHLHPTFNQTAESFDISGKVDTEDPIYKFYEKTVGKYLSNKYGAVRVTDPQGQSWWEIPVDQDLKNRPIDAFGLALGVQPDDDGKMKVNPTMAILGVLGSRFFGPEFKGLTAAVAREIASATEASAIRDILLAQGMRKVAAYSLSKELVGAKTEQQVKDLLTAAPNKEEVTRTPTEEESLEILSGQQNEFAPYLESSPKEEAQLIDNLSAVFAEMKGVNVADIGGFTDEDLDLAKQHYDYLRDAMLDHPGRALMKFVSKETGELPELKPQTEQERLGPDGMPRKDSRGVWQSRGDEILQDLVGQELSGGGDVTIGQKLVDEYRAMRTSLAEVQSSFRAIRKSVRLEKAKGKFVESSQRAIARQIVKDTTTLRNLVEAAQRAGFRKGVQAGNKKVSTIISRIRERRQKVVALKKIYDLSNAQMRDVTKEKDWRLIKPEEFDTWIAEVEERAKHENQKDIQKQIIDSLIETLELKNVENIRHALELPAISKMDLAQLQEYENALSQYEKGDSFVGPRMITTLENTNLAGARTWREIRTKLAEETGTDVTKLVDVRGSEFDKFTYDQALMDTNPLYRYMVTEFAAKDVENAQKLLSIEHTLNTLAKASRASRPNKTNKLVPQDREVFGWLETAEEEQAAYAKMRKMTPQELEYANFVKELYRNWRDTLIEKGTLKKWREAYVTHTPRSFLERWLDESRVESPFKAFVKSVVGSWRQFTDTKVDFPAVGDTGTVLGLEKFFKYSLPRGKEVVPSKNVARVVMQYARTFYKKDALDQIIPKVEAYTLALQRTPGPGIPKDPTGLNVDGNLKAFVKRWLNNKKGRREMFMAEQGGRVDVTLRIINFVITMHDLGFNLIAQPTSMIGELEANFIGMELPEFVTGAKRLATKEGRAVAAKHPGVVGDPPFNRLVNAANDASDTFMAGAYYIFQEVSYRARQQYFLGLLTPAEMKSGVVSSARQAEIKNKMGMVRPLEGSQSVVGSTSEGKLLTKYKTWAVPLLTTMYRDFKQVAVYAKKARAGDTSDKAKTAESGRRILRTAVASLGIYLFFSYIFTQEKSKSPLGRLEAKILQELMSAYSTFDPRTWTKVRVYDFANKMAADVAQLALMETYKVSGTGYEKGDLKALRSFSRDLAPAFVRQFITEETKAAAGSTNSTPSKKNPALDGIMKLRKTAGAHANPALERLKKMKKSSGTKNPALERLRTIRSGR